MNDLVSIVIPTFNRVNFTNAAYQSAIKQTHQSIEVIVVDNGSNVETKDSLQELGVPFIECLTPGAGAARKAGMEMSSGKFLLFLDSDDLLTPDAVEILVNAITQNFHGAFGLIKNKNITKRNFLNSNEEFLSPLASNTLLKKEVFEIFEHFTDDNYSWPTWLMSAQKSGMSLKGIKEVVTHRVLHGNNLSLTESSMSYYFKEIRKRLNNQ